MDLESWLNTNTYHHSAFLDRRALIAEKEKQGLSISLCLPTLNEESTIGKEILIFQAELRDRYPLLDEIAVIDSGSTDRTREIAKRFGADVYLASECLPETGEHHGKGENLWKALYILKGDILVYIDADIKNIHPRFVWGLVGPLIQRRELQYVKAFYDRPLATTASMRPSGGGRVTEILVRPLFSLFFPELTGIIQPLSGEYAGRRTVLEKIPFPVGYGVETSMLIDIYRRWGLDALGQCDLDRRVHRNQDNLALGRMSFNILHTFFSRLKALGMIEDIHELSTVMSQFQVEDHRYNHVIYPLEPFERPPMVEVEAYRKKFGIS